MLIGVAAAAPAVMRNPANGSGAWLPEPATSATAAQVATRRAVDASRRTAIVQATERVSPSVVSVSVIRQQAVQRRTLFDDFFLPPGATREVSGLGSGFIIRDDGLVLTNEHVAGGATKVVVSLPDGREFEAELVGADDRNDLALLRMRLPAGTTVPVAPIGRSDDLMVGEWVLAVGNPFGYLLGSAEPTVTAGVVSAVHRNILPDRNDRGLNLDMIQTDAPINPGNSGGPLVNALGEVVGVNTSILSRSGGSEGLGFAIPIDRARRIALDLLDDGAVRRAWVGFDLEPAVEPDRFGGQRRIARIGTVTPASPAERSGLRSGMIIVSAGGLPVRTPLDWDARLLDAVVGEPIEIMVRDGERERIVHVVPQDLPSLSAERVNALSAIEMITVSAAIRSERAIASEGGALIVKLSSEARQLGLREGDVIVRIDRTRIRSADEAAELLQQLRQPRRRYMTVVLERNGQYLQTSF